MKRLLDREALGAGSLRSQRCGGWTRRRDETGQALVEFALVLPLIILIMGVAFNGWNGMQQAVRLTSAARAGAIIAANDLATDVAPDPTQPPTQTEIDSALTDATTAVNQEEGVSGVYQSGNPSWSNYVSIATQNVPISSTPTLAINTVTITISPASVTLIPFVGHISVTTHAVARFS